MLHKKIASIPAFTAEDGTTLREVIHPKNDLFPLAYSLAHASLGPGLSSYPHQLLNQNELYIFTKGEGLIFINEEKKRVEAGEVVLVPAGATQYVENTSKEDLVFFCLVDPPWKKEDEVILEY